MGIKLIIFDLAFVCASHAPEFSLTSNFRPPRSLQSHLANFNLTSLTSARTYKSHSVLFSAPAYVSFNNNFCYNTFIMDCYLHQHELTVVYQRLRQIQDPTSL